MHILFAGADGWTLHVGADPARPRIIAAQSASAAEVAAAVRDALESAGHDGGALAIGVPSTWCLAATITTADVPRNDPRAMVYRLEESLPVAAEHVVADFVDHPATGTALGVCIRTDQIAPVVGAIEAAGIAVQAILPTALVTAEAVARRGDNPARLLLVGDRGPHGPQVNLIFLTDGRPSQWVLSSASESDLQLQLKLLSTQVLPSTAITGVDVSPATIAVVEKLTGVRVSTEPTAGSIVATAMMADILGRRTKAWINFRRGSLAIADPLRMHRKWIDLSLVAAVLFLLSVVAALLLRAGRYSRIDTESSAEMVADFHNHLPTWQIPANIPAVVDAQFRKSIDGRSADAGETGRGSTLAMLHDVLLPMPAGPGFQVERMSFHGDSFVIDGRTQSFDQIDAIARAVRSGGMTVAPAQSRRESDGHWAFTLQGARSKTTPIGTVVSGS